MIDENHLMNDRFCQKHKEALTVVILSTGNDVASARHLGSLLVF